MKPLDQLAAPLLQGRLVVPGVDRRRPAVHEQEDAVFRLWLEVRVLRRQGIGRRAGAGVGGGSVTGEEAVLVEQGRQGQAGEAGSRLPQEFAACAGAERCGVAVRHDAGTPKLSKRLMLLL